MQTNAKELDRLLRYRAMRICVSCIVYSWQNNVRGVKRVHMRKHEKYADLRGVIIDALRCYISDGDQ